MTTKKNVAAALEIAARAEERARVSLILESPEAQGRQKLAQELALRTNVDPENARALLLASPKEDAFGEALLANVTGLSAATAGFSSGHDDAKARRIEELKTAAKGAK